MSTHRPKSVRALARRVHASTEPGPAAGDGQAVIDATDRVRANWERAVRLEPLEPIDPLP